MKHSYQILVLAAIAISAFYSCKKDETTGPQENLTNGKTTAVFNPNVTYGTMTDQDGNIYKTVTIGTQTWMAENLRTTKYNDGTEVPNLNGNWVGLTDGAYCNYKVTTNVDTIATFGRLYNWYAAHTGKLAPVGWHIPSDLEWAILVSYLGGTGEAGAKLKEFGTLHWGSPNIGASNESGFTALPGGSRGDAFYDIGNTGFWWSTSDDGGDGIWIRYIYSSSNEILRINTAKFNGLSIRCVKD